MYYNKYKNQIEKNMEVISSKKGTNEKILFRNI